MAISEDKFVEISSTQIGGGGSGTGGGGDTPPLVQAVWGDITGDIQDQTDLIELIESSTPEVVWGGITGTLTDQTDLVAYVAAQVAAGKQIIEVTTAQMATIIAAGVPTDKKLVYRTTDTGVTRLYYWDGLRFSNLARAGKSYDGAPSVARHAQRYACPNNTQGVRVMPLNVNVRKFTLRNKSAFILQISQSKYLPNDDINIPTTGWVDIPVGQKATIWFPRGQIWCRYKTAAENNNIASLYAETEFIS
jgi:hypothetical protein